MPTPAIIVRQGTDAPDVTLAVEVLVVGGSEDVQRLRTYMYGTRCRYGMLLTRDRLWLLEEVDLENKPESISVIGDFPTPPTIWPRLAATMRSNSELEYLAQEWIERLPETIATEPGLSDRLRNWLNVNAVPIVAYGEVYAGRPRPGLRAVGRHPLR